MFNKHIRHMLVIIFMDTPDLRNNLQSKKI